MIGKSRESIEKSRPAAGIDREKRESSRKSGESIEKNRDTVDRL
ncbi:hypothetical protein [Salibacterium qingdaonense]|nr:hypothetical protein [Salibacterium qingdaonense]